MGYESYSQINNLEEVSLIAGTEYTFNFTVLNENGTSLNLNGATITWMLSYYGSDVAIVTKTVSNGITVTGENTFKVVLDSESSLPLEGIFIQQPVIQDFNGSIFRPGQGRVTIGSAIQ